MNTIAVHRDALSVGQIQSKVYLRDTLFASYEVASKSRQRYSQDIIWVLGGWHGMLPFLILTHPNADTHVASVRSFDVDPSCEEVANTINNAFVYDDWRFRAFTKDVNELEYDANGGYGSPPSLVINTSVEHFESMCWYDAIPVGTRVLLTANNMPHDQHCTSYDTLDDLINKFEPRRIHESGSLKFSFPDVSYERHYLYGVK